MKPAVNGPITRVKYNPKNGKFSVKGKAVATGAETTDAAYVVFAFESGELYLPDAGAGIAKKSGIVWKP